MLSIDEFDTGALDSAWNVKLGGLGTVSLLTASRATGIYDLTTVPDHLAFQVENNEVSMYRDYTLADGKSVVVKLLPSINISSNVAGEIRVGMSLTTTDNGPSPIYPALPTANGYMQLIFDATTDGYRLLGDYATLAGTNNDATAQSGGDEETAITGNTCYLRITRVGSAYLWFVSMNGLSWTPFKTTVTPPNIFTKLWLFARSQVATGSDILPVQLIDWVREFDSTEFDVRDEVSS